MRSADIPITSIQTDTHQLSTVDNSPLGNISAFEYWMTLGNFVGAFVD